MGLEGDQRSLGRGFPQERNRLFRLIEKFAANAQISFCKGGETDDDMYENMISIDRKAHESFQKQIRRQIAIGIVNRQYPLHRPLPSIRRLSAELQVSVTTVAPGL